MNLRKSFVLLFGLLVCFGATTLWALERGEVVIIATGGAGPDARETRVWIAEDAGELWLEANNPLTPWYLHVVVQPELKMARAGEIESYRAEPYPGPAGHIKIRGLMRKKYGLADRWVALIAGDPASVAVRLRRLPARGTAPPP